MSEPAPQTAAGRGPSPKLILVLFIVAGALLLIGFAIDKSARSKDEAIGAILPTLLGLLLLVTDFVLLVVLLIRRRRARPSA